MRALLTSLLLVPASVWGAAWLSPEADRLILRGLDAGYRAKLDEADRLFREVDRLAPEHPAGPFFRASLVWSRFSLEADVPDAGYAFELDFEKHIREAMLRAEKRVKDRGPDAEAYFYLGAAHGMRGRWRGAQKKWFRAALHGAKGLRYMKKTVKLDPEMHDAYLGIGMYEYYAGALPKILKGLARVFVAKGDKEEGLRHIRLALTKGRYSVTEAKVFLTGAYAGHENSPEEALKLAQELRRERPENPFFIWLDLASRIGMKDWPGAIESAEALADAAEKAPELRQARGLFSLSRAKARVGGRRFGEALAILDRCVEGEPLRERGTAVYCRLFRAQTLDLLGRREEAKAEYRRVKKLPDFLGSRKRAKKGLKSPATYESAVERLRIE